ncbi:MAG: DUF624 domain-containing protein [Clostridia bacterium]|nr:DUF624 domain-containing protein [Clostridia bacterium]
MFGRMMNNYYYGKSGKGDFRKEDLPETRSQLFRDTLRTRLSALCRLNLLYMLVWLPTMIVIMISAMNMYSSLTQYMLIQDSDYSSYTEVMSQYGQENIISEEQFNEIAAQPEQFSQYLSLSLRSSLTRLLLWLIPCIAITGPFTAGLSYVTRNWARDEHAFVWSDFKDAVRENWKQALVISAITGFLPLAVYEGWSFYGEMASQNMILIIPQVLVILVGIIWAISVTYMYPIIVTYELKQKDVLRNSLLLGVARLPFSVGIRLLHCVPVLLFFVAVWFFGLDLMIGLMILGGYYMLIGFSLSRFITASYTNAVFDRFINSRIEGAKVNQGLKTPEDDDDEDEAGTEDETDPE